MLVSLLTLIEVDGRGSTDWLAPRLLRAEERGVREEDSLLRFWGGGELILRNGRECLSLYALSRGLNVEASMERTTSTIVLLEAENGRWRRS